VKVVERDGDVFVVMKAQYTHSAASVNNNATNAGATYSALSPFAGIEGSLLVGQV
jgi:hypothetical protein